MLFEQKDKSREQKIHEIYMLVYSRPPQSDETAVAVNYLGRAKEERQAYEDILWALINTKEFLFNH
jgi:hypothetical protein